MSLGPLVDVKTKLMQIRQKVGKEQVKVEQTRSRVVQMRADLAVQRKAEVVKLEEVRTRCVRSPGEVASEEKYVTRQTAKNGRMLPRTRIWTARQHVRALFFTVQMYCSLIVLWKRVMHSSERDPVEVDVKRRVQNVAICTKLYTFHE